MNRTLSLMKVVTGFVAVVSALFFAAGWMYATWLTFFGALMLLVSGVLYTAIAAADQEALIGRSQAGMRRMPMTGISDRDAVMRPAGEPKDRHVA